MKYQAININEDYQGFGSDFKTYNSLMLRFRHFTFIPPPE